MGEEEVGRYLNVFWGMYMMTLCRDSDITSVFLAAFWFFLYCSSGGVLFVGLVWFVCKG